MEGDIVQGKDLSSYPLKPKQPLDEDCCGSGCATCVFDLYELDLKRWKRNCDEIDLCSSSSGRRHSGDDNDDDDDDVLNIYEYKLFKIVDIQIVSSCITMFTFEIPGNGRLPLDCGKHIIARAYSSAQQGKAIIRPYTPISKRTDRGFFKIAAKIYENGKMSECMKGWCVGNEIEWRGPFGEFSYKLNEYKMLVMIAGGTGVAPMIQIMREVLDNEDDFMLIRLFYSVQHSSEIILKDVLTEWASFWNCKILFCLTGEDSGMGNMRYGDQIHNGRLNTECLRSYLPELPTDGFKVLICGSKQFNEDLSHLVIDAYEEVKEENIFCFD